MLTNWLPKPWRIVVKKGVLCGACLLLAYVGAWGDVISQTNAFSHAVPGTTNLVFNQFDDSLGVLQSVEFIMSGFQQANASVENGTNISDVIITLTLNGSLAGTNSLPGLAPLVALPSLSTNSPPLAAADGTPNGGPDFYNFGLLTSAAANDSDFVSGAFLSSYVGLGTYLFTVAVGGGWNFSGVGAAVIGVSGFAGEGEVIVNYTFAIPEVSFGWILAPMLGGIIWLRRRTVR